MKIIPYGSALLANAIEFFMVPEGLLVIESPDDYANAPPAVAAEVAARALRVAPDVVISAAFEAELAAKQAAEFEAFKARSGEPSYKAAAVKIAAEKLALTPLIDAALDVLINADGDKSLYVWWIETDAISRGDAQWQRIEGAVEWPKDVTATDLFDLAAMI